LFFWLIGGLVYTGVLAQAITSKGRALHWLIDICLVGLLGRIETTALFVILGLFAATAILMYRDPA